MCPMTRGYAHDSLQQHADTDLRRLSAIFYFASHRDVGDFWLLRTGTG